MNSYICTKTLMLIDENATIQMGHTLAKRVKSLLNSGVIVYLNGELGAGKTTLTRGFVQGMGHKGNVKSPTYTLVEPYDLGDWQIYHFDLYRLADAEELEYMGIRDYFNDRCCSFIEWPEKGKGLIPEPDLVIELIYDNEQRQIKMNAQTEKGERLLNDLSNN